jgi:hypothetical protein
MKSPKYLVIALCIAVAIPSTTLAQDNLRDQLIGMWLDYRSDNLVYFAKNGTFKLYLKKGEAGRSIIGNWVLAPDRTLTISWINMQGQRINLARKLSFDGQEMVLTNKDGKQARHRRIKGSIPERFQQ